MTDTMDEIGRLADQLDNALFGLKLPGLPDRLHIEGLSGTMREVRDKLAEIVKRETGENPWDGNPLMG